MNSINIIPFISRAAEDGLSLIPDLMLGAGVAIGSTALLLQFGQEPTNAVEQTVSVAAMEYNIVPSENGALTTTPTAQEQRREAIRNILAGPDS